MGPLRRIAAVVFAGDARVWKSAAVAAVPLVALTAFHCLRPRFYYTGTDSVDEATLHRRLPRARRSARPRTWNCRPARRSCACEPLSHARAPAAASGAARRRRARTISSLVPGARAAQSHQQRRLPDSRDVRAAGCARSPRCARTASRRHVRMGGARACPRSPPSPRSSTARRWRRRWRSGSCRPRARDAAMCSAPAPSFGAPRCFGRARRRLDLPRAAVPRPAGARAPRGALLALALAAAVGARAERARGCSRSPRSTSPAGR